MMNIFHKLKPKGVPVLAFLLALVMVIGIAPFTATEVHAMTVNASGDVTWESGDSFTLVLASKENPSKTETHKVTHDGTNWSELKSSILPAHAFAYTGEVTDITCTDGKWSYKPVLQLDQSTAEKLANADVMTATGEATTNAQLKLHFEHYFAKVTFRASFNAEFSSGSDEITEFRVVNPDSTYTTLYNNNGSYTAIMRPATYSQRSEFALIEVNGNKDNPLQALVPAGMLTLEAGTHYTFDLTVGKDVVTLTPASTSTDFPGGWTNVDNDGKDFGLNHNSGIQVNGKTAWENGDKVFVHLYSEEYGHQSTVMTFENGDWKSDGEILKYLKAENPKITAVYAPDYEIKPDGSIGLKDGKLPGMAEYIPAETTLAGNDLNIRFAGVQRSYSRLRIATMPGASLTVNTTGFTPAGATEAGEHNYTLTADANGNAFLYGSFKKDATLEVTAEHEIYPAGGITEALTFKSDWQIKVGRSYAFAVKLGDKYDPATAFSGDIALLDGSFVSLYNIGSMTDEQKAAAVGIVFWTRVEADLDGRTYPESLTDDKVMNADFPHCTHGLIVSFKQLQMQWQKTAGSVADFQSQSDAFKEYVSIAPGSDDAAFNQIFGYQNTKVLQAYNANCGANSAVNPVAELADFSAKNPAPIGSTGWYLPSVKELYMLCNEGLDDIANTTGTVKKDEINGILSQIGEELLANVAYWSSTEQDGDKSMGVNFANGRVTSQNKNAPYYVRFICAF